MNTFKKAARVALRVLQVVCGCVARFHAVRACGAVVVSSLHHGLCCAALRCACTALRCACTAPRTYSRVHGVESHESRESSVARRRNGRFYRTPRTSRHASRT